MSGPGSTRPSPTARARCRPGAACSARRNSISCGPTSVPRRFVRERCSTEGKQLHESAKALFNFLVNLPFERHDQRSDGVEALPSPGVEFGLFAARQVDVDFGLIAGEFQSEPLL